MSAVSTALIVGVVAAGASAGATAYAAKKGSDAAKDAAKTQGDAADKALAFQKEQYDLSRKDFDPYAQQSQAALARLSALSAQPAQGFRQPAPPPQQLGMPQGQPPRMTTQPMPQAGPQMPPAAPDRQSAIASFGQAPQPPPERMVTLRAPDGTTHPFPASQVQAVIQQAQAKGHQLQVVG